MKFYKNRNVLLFGDTHYPFHHPDAFAFLRAVKKKYDPDRVFHLGDLSDQYVFSSYTKIPQADNVPTELKKTRKAIKELHSIFPQLSILESNHDDRLYRRGRINGIPRELILPYKDIIGASDYQWRWVSDVTIRLSDKKHLYLTHVKSGTAISVAKMLGMNVAMAHHHTKFSINYYTTPLSSYWGVDIGCLINDDRYAFAYNKQSIIRPVLGCCLIKNGSPLLIPMKLMRNNRWTKKLE